MRIEPTVYLRFEGEIERADREIVELIKLGNQKGIHFDRDITRIERARIVGLRAIYSNLTPWQTVQVARHPQRPILADYLGSIVTDFVQLHGDRVSGDDPAIVTGFGKIGGIKAMIIGHNKGRRLEEKKRCRFGCSNPEGYRKALRAMKLAEKFGLPVVTFIDTPGAYPGVEAEERGQATAIAQNLKEMSRLRVPIVCVVIGEGGSGGALGIGVGDRLAMLEFAYLSVISPEGCAGILWRDGTKAEEAAKALKLTSKDLLNLGLIDKIIPEPIGGAQRNPNDAIHNVGRYIVGALIGLSKTRIKKILGKRQKKLRLLGSATITNRETNS